MADLTAIASLATAGGTLVLAIATFGSVRSANRAARVAEQSLLVGLRPVLAASRLDDSEQKINWGDQHWTRLRGGHAGVELTDEVLYLSMSLRNVGNGIAVLQAWDAIPTPAAATDRHRPIDEFRSQQRDLFIASGDVSFWQGAFREPAAPEFAALAAVVRARERFSIDLLYRDHEGGQRAISRFGIFPAESSDAWLCAVTRHWRIDGVDPR
jgi:hypothetical protein